MASEPGEPSNRLDSLLSPSNKNSQATLSRDLQIEVPADDDLRSSIFSTIPLTATSRRSTISIPSSDAAVVKEQLHKKSSSASNSASSSGGNAPFILARLGAENKANHRATVSQDGQQKLQEEFARMQTQREEEEEESVNAAIDWGEHSVHSLSIYHSKPELDSGQTSGEL